MAQVLAQRVGSSDFVAGAVPTFWTSLGSSFGSSVGSSSAVDTPTDTLDLSIGHVGKIVQTIVRTMGVGVDEEIPHT